MVLHPDFHPNHGTPVSLSERIYIVKYYESDGPRSIGFALGRTETSIMQLVSTMRKNGDWDLYQGLSDEEWTAILKTEKEKSPYADPWPGCVGEHLLLAISYHTGDGEGNDHLTRAAAGEKLRGKGSD
jgi:hypothetical protein